MGCWGLGLLRGRLIVQGRGEMSANERYRYGAGEIGTQKPGKETEKVVAGMEGDGKGKGVEVK